MEIDAEKIEEYSEHIGEDIQNAIATLESENPSQFSDERALIRVLNRLIDRHNDTFCTICDELAREQVEENRLAASEALHDARKEDCLDVARNVGSIPWPACQVNPGRKL